MPKLYRNHSSACVFSCKFSAYFQNNFQTDAAVLSLTQIAEVAETRNKLSELHAIQHPLCIRRINKEKSVYVKWYDRELHQIYGVMVRIKVKTGCDSMIKGGNSWSLQVSG